MFFYRMRYLYELFFDDAIKAAKLLDITSPRAASLMVSRQIKMAGVPITCRAISGQARENGRERGHLRANGRSGCHQIKPERKVVRIVTPGTLTDSAFLEDKETNPIVAVCSVKSDKNTSASPSFAAKRRIQSQAHHARQARRRIGAPASGRNPAARCRQRPERTSGQHHARSMLGNSRPTAAKSCLPTISAARICAASGWIEKNTPPPSKAAGALLNYIRLTQSRLPQHLDGPRSNRKPTHHGCRHPPQSRNHPNPERPKSAHPVFPRSTNAPPTWAAVCSPCGCTTRCAAANISAPASKPCSNWPTIMNTYKAV